MPPSAKAASFDIIAPSLTRESIIQRIVGIGHECEVVEQLMQLFDELSGKRHLVDTGEAYVFVDTDVHDALDDIMKGNAVEAPEGSIHASLNAFYGLPADQTFVHSQRDYCSLEIACVLG